VTTEAGKNRASSQENEKGRKEIEPMKQRKTNWLATGTFLGLAAIAVVNVESPRNVQLVPDTVDYATVVTADTVSGVDVNSVVNVD
jgi:hypothetical protein